MMRFVSDFAAVLVAAQAGDADAWVHLYRTYAGPIAGYLRLQGATDVDDLTSEVFLGVLRGIGRFRGDESQLRSWVFVIAHRRLQDQRRAWFRRPPDVPLDDTAAAHAGAGDVETDALRALSAERVRELCAGLSSDQRDVVLLRMVGDLSLEQVAEVLGKTTGAVKALQHRAISALERSLAGEGVSP